MNDKYLGITLIVFSIILIALAVVIIVVSKKSMEPESLMFFLGIAGIITGILLIQKHDNGKTN